MGECIGVCAQKEVRIGDEANGLAGAAVRQPRHTA